MKSSTKHYSLHDICDSVDFKISFKTLKINDDDLKIFSFISNMIKIIKIKMS